MSQLDECWNIIELAETESTNLYLKKLIVDQHLDELTVVSAEFQSKGRGQMGNTWNANRGENLLFSILIYPRMIFANEQFIISQTISVAISNVLNKIVDNIKVKWPNDIYWNDKKIAGILIENNLRGKIIDSSIIGVGLNINQKVFSEGLINPVSLFQITGQEYDKSDVLEQIMKEFVYLYNELKESGELDIEEQYFENLYRSQGYHWYQDVGGKFQAQIIDVQPTGHLVLRALNEDNDRIYSFKEVQFINE